MRRPLLSLKSRVIAPILAFSLAAAPACSTVRLRQPVDELVPDTTKIVRLPSEFVIADLRSFDEDGELTLTLREVEQRRVTVERLRGTRWVSFSMSGYLVAKELFFFVALGGLALFLDGYGFFSGLFREDVEFIGTPITGFFAIFVPFGIVNDTGLYSSERAGPPRVDRQDAAPVTVTRLNRSISREPQPFTLEADGQTLRARTDASGRYQTSFEGWALDTLEDGRDRLRVTLRYQDQREVLDLGLAQLLAAADRSDAFADDAERREFWRAVRSRADSEALAAAAAERIALIDARGS